MVTLQNNFLKVDISTKGAELQSIFNKKHKLEYLWQADPQFWAKKSPVLFPIVGTLKEDTYYYKDKPYKLSRHGFAREKAFMVTAQTADSATFTLENSDETVTVYPFSFQFNIIYALQEDSLSVTYSVLNRSEGEMYFSVGGHPAFKVPLEDGTKYDDYSLVFEKNETAGRWPISKDGLIEKAPEPLLNNTDTLPLTKELFKRDALVLKQLQSASVRLTSNKTPHGLHFTFTDFPFLGLWAAPGADFVCIEPWCGIADSVDSNQQLTNKEGIQQLAPSNTFNATWKVQVY